MSLFKLGEIQRLQVAKPVPMGAYLTVPDTMMPDGEERELILLPKKEMPDDIQAGDLIDVFIYKDSEDRPIATTIIPPLTVGKTAILKVSQVTDIGAFLSWGLVKDLFLPFKEQTYRVNKGDSVLVSLYIDKSNRLCATMKLYNILSTDSDYTENSSVTGTIYELSDNYGAFVAVDNIYSALIPKNELFRKVYIGERIHARVKSVREDGKLTLSIREKTQYQIESNSKIILERLNENDGYLPYGDKSSPEDIKREFEMSKSEFKRAIGNLYKNKMILIKDDGIHLVV